MRVALAVVALAWLTGSGLAETAKRKSDPAKSEGAKDSSDLSRDAINGATFDKDKKAASKRPDPLTIKVQVLLDRARFSPGAIDGRDGENLQGALSAFAVAQGMQATKAVTQEVFDKLQATNADPATVEYTVTEADVAGPFEAKIPPKMEQQAELDSLGYTDVREMLAERFHMSGALLDALNPDKPLDKAGTVITVAAVPAMERGKGNAKTPKVIARIEVDKESRQVRGFDKEGKLQAFYPASIGSEEKPAPSGSAKVEGVAFEPPYTYNPEYAFEGVKSKEKFTIKPGPNNPVGLVWIDLSIPSYGIHGTPDPEKVGKTESHGCIRLTNWDARDLASRVEKGAKVEFKDE